MSEPIFELEDALKAIGATITKSWHDGDADGIGLAVDDTYVYMYSESHNNIRVAIKKFFDRWSNSTDVEAELPHDWASFRLFIGVLDSSEDDCNITSIMSNIP